LGSFIHSFSSFQGLKFQRILVFLADRDGQVSGEQTAVLSIEPEADKKNQDNRGYAEPRDENHLDSDVASGRNVVLDSRIAVEEPVTIAKKVCASRQVNEEEEGRGDSQSGKSRGINHA
jgi:hypothetical protein